MLCELLYMTKKIIKVYVLPIFMAGGSAYWRRSTNWYKGSICTKPKCVAPLIIRTPKIGSKIYRTAMIPIIVQNGVLAPFNPAHLSTPMKLLIKLNVDIKKLAQLYI